MNVAWLPGHEPTSGTLIGDTGQVAAMLGISTRHVRRLAREGKFQAIGKTLTGKQGRPASVFALVPVSEAWAREKGER
jgi:hypothetical protein